MAFFKGQPLIKRIERLLRCAELFIINYFTADGEVIHLHALRVRTLLKRVDRADLITGRLWTEG